MRPSYKLGHGLRGVGVFALALLLSGCGQTGYLYLVMQPTTFPPITRHTLPIPSAVTLEMAACVSVPVLGTNVAPVAAPFAATSVEQVPFSSPLPAAPQPAPSSITDILPACAVFPDIITPSISLDGPPYP